MSTPFRRLLACVGLVLACTIVTVAAYVRGLGDLAADEPAPAVSPDGACEMPAPQALTAGPCTAAVGCSPVDPAG